MGWSRSRQPESDARREVIEEVIQLDTSFLILALIARSDQDAALRRMLRKGEQIAISAIAWTEFQCGPVSPAAIDVARHLLGDPIPFSADDAGIAAALFNETGRRRGTLMDCMIAAPAINAGASIATANHADFRRFEQFGLALA
jgi:predicted nucleic acid-binding protein